jgi:hypothetical protein
LGILDLECFARALHLRWYWLRWKQADRPWTGLDIPCDKNDLDLFNASKIVKVGKGDKASFWHSSWINGNSPKNIAPSLFAKGNTEEYLSPKGPPKQHLDCTYLFFILERKE